MSERATFRLPMIPSIVRRSDQPSPQALRPCCPMALANACQFRPSMVRAYLFTRNDAHLAGGRSREDWIEYLADKLRGDALSENLLVQNNRGHGGLIEKARDIVLSLERCRDELGIPLAVSSSTRLAAALCRYSCDTGVDE